MDRSQLKIESRKAFLFGANGNLGRFWISALRDLEYSILGYGVEVKFQFEEVFSNLKYECLDLSLAPEEIIVEKLEKEKPYAIVYNAGIDSRPGSGKSEISKYSVQEWNDILSVNLLGAVKVLNAVGNCKNPPKRVIVIGSMYSTKSPNSLLYAHYGENGQIKHPAYAASKAALLSTVKQFASNYIARDIYVNMISPGAIYGNQDEEFLSKISSRIPANRLGQGIELIPSLKFLLEDSNCFFVGQNLIVDGGMNLW